MAISFVQQTTVSGTATNCVLTRPAGTANGDLLIATVELFDGGNVIDAIAGTGWTVLDIVKNTAAGNAHSMATLWRLDNGSATYTITWDASSQFRTGQLLAYTGGPTGIDVHSLAAQTNNASTTLRGTTVTTTKANAMVVMVGCTGNVGTGITPPGSMTERVDTNRQYAADVIQAVAGATGNKDATQASADASIGGLIALIPPVTATRPTPRRTPRAAAATNRTPAVYA